MNATRYTTQGDLACSWCGYVIPVRNDMPQDWASFIVAGAFCSKSHAEAAGNNVSYRERFGWDRVTV